MGLRIFAWPRTWVLLNPDWILLVVLYWCLMIPKRFNIGSAWTVGVLADVLTGQVLGQSALAYTLVAYIVVRFHLRIRLFRISQQTMVVFCLLLLAQVLGFWTQNIQGAGLSLNWMFWVPPWSGALLWPVVYILLGGLQHTAQIE